MQYFAKTSYFLPKICLFLRNTAFLEPCDYNHGNMSVQCAGQSTGARRPGCEPSGARPDLPIRRDLCITPHVVSEEARPLSFLTSLRYARNDSEVEFWDKLHNSLRRQESRTPLTVPSRPLLSQGWSMRRGSYAKVYGSRNPKPLPAKLRCLRRNALTRGGFSNNEKALPSMRLHGIDRQKRGDCCKPGGPRPSHRN